MFGRHHWFRSTTFGLYSFLALLIIERQYSLAIAIDVNQPPPRPLEDGWDPQGLWKWQVKSDKSWALLRSGPPKDSYRETYFLLSYIFDPQTTPLDTEAISKTLGNFLDIFGRWIAPTEIFQLAIVPNADAPLELPKCPGPGCSDVAICGPMLQALKDFFDGLDGAKGDGAETNITKKAFKFDQDMGNFPPFSRGSNIKQEYHCPVALVNTSMIKQQADFFCDSEAYNKSAANWLEQKTDESLDIFIRGGIDRVYRGISGFYYPPVDLASTHVSQALRARFSTPTSNIPCSLKDPCPEPPECRLVGEKFLTQKPRFKLPWAYFTMWAIRNLNQEMRNQYDAMQSAAIDATLATFNVDDYFPESGKNFPLLNLLTGLGTVFAAAAGVLAPFAAAASGTLGAASAVAPGIGTYYERAFQNTVDRSDPDVAQKTFAPKLRKVYDLFSASLENFTTALFAGQEIEGGVSLQTLLKGGKWLESSSLSNVSDAQNQLFVEIFSRSIDALWKTETSNKMWVLFVNTADVVPSTANCEADLTGPQDMKYCGDGGVYYAYNFVENGHSMGHLSYPWGANKMMDKIGIDPKWIVEGSAKTYQLAIWAKGELNPFNYKGAWNGTRATQLTLATEWFNKDLKGMGGRYPGSWTLPVCNTLDWGKSWNYNYTASTIEATDNQDLNHFPPCLCGAGGKETAEWGQAAGLRGFDTWYDRCFYQLTSDYINFQWPAGVTEVDLGFRDKIKKPGT